MVEDKVRAEVLIERIDKPHGVKSSVVLRVVYLI